MPAAVINIVTRDNANPPMSHTMLNLLVVLIVLLIVVLLLVAALLFLRQRRKTRRRAALKLDAEERVSVSPNSSSHSPHDRLTVRPSETLHVFREKQNLIDHSSSPPSPSSALPEIRITFPEEYDACGKRQSGRVVVVTLSDASVGLGPVDSSLPPYELEGERFHSIDLERVGGLVEKARNAPLGWKN